MDYEHIVAIAIAVVVSIISYFLVRMVKQNDVKMEEQTKKVTELSEKVNHVELNYNNKFLEVRLVSQEGDAKILRAINEVAISIAQVIEKQAASNDKLAEQIETCKAIQADKRRN